jgi:hypothetical protein
MTEQTGDFRDESRGTAAERLEVDADAVRAGDTVVFESKLNKAYEFVVADVDAEWITFETGQKVHKNRFDREDFAVRRNVREESGNGRSDEADGDESGGPAAAESEPDADKRRLRAPNAN